MSRLTPWAAVAVLAVCGVSGAWAAPRDGMPVGTEPRLVRVYLGPSHGVATLLTAGLDVIESEAGDATILAWPGDEATVARLGLRSEILDEHPGRTAARRAQVELDARPAPVLKRVRSAVRPDGRFRTEGYPPFGSGSMGGYWTTAEIKMKLDDLVASDASDVVANKLDTLGTTVLGRPIWGLRLGKTVMGPDTRPVALFNSLTHAREPGGMQALFYFVDDLLSKYGSDPFATYLLDKRVIYIVPLVNPDGYDANEDTYFNNATFGFWRKNARDNNGNMTFDAGDGVDLNRNFGYKWAWNDSGSSGNSNTDLYRGPAAFSEPETQAQRDLVTALQPKTGISFHTYGDYMIHPWGWTVAPVPHAGQFKEWSDELTRENAYLSGAAPAVLYQVNGEFNDWCYGDTLTKPRAFSWTPEIGTGSDGFWPPPSRIVPLSQENLRACYVVAAIAGPFVQEDGVEIVEGAMNAGHLANLRIRARNLGSSGSAGPDLTGTLTALDTGVHVIVGTASYPTLGPFQSANPASPFRVTVSDTVTPGRLVRFRVAFTAPDGFYSSDTLAIPAGTPTLVFADDASSGLGLWTGAWGIVANHPDHPSRFFADSPDSTYGPNVDNRLLLNAPLNLSAGVHAYALYEARWEFEQNDDAGSIEASLDGSTFTRLSATGTTPGSGLQLTNQPLNKPLYAGSRQLWKPERADLSAFAGPTATAVRLRFRVLSDGGNQNGLRFDGFNFDSLRIVLYDPAAQPAPVAVGDGETPSAMELAAPWPNPARGLARFSFALPEGGPVRLEILDLQGRRIRTLAHGTLAANRYVRGWDLRDQAGHVVAPGMYLAHLTGGAQRITRRFVVVE